jgi:CheY-like chemotaxis protein
MVNVLVIDDHPHTWSVFETLLQDAGYLVSTVASGAHGVELLLQRRFGCVITELRLPDVSGIDILKTVRREHAATPVFIVTAFGNIPDAVAAMRLGATDFIEKPVREEDLVARLRRDVPLSRGRSAAAGGSDADDWERHAAARWARAVVPIVTCPKDPRTVRGWSRWVAVSPGALRSWCRTAGVSPRRSLLFGRLLRVAALSESGRRKPEYLLDVVDRRTLAGLLRLAGFANEHAFPTNSRAFLDRQQLVENPEMLSEIVRALEAGQRSVPH